MLSISMIMVPPCEEDLCPWNMAGVLDAQRRFDFGNWSTDKMFLSLWLPHIHLIVSSGKLFLLTPAFVCISATQHVSFDVVILEVGT